MLIHARCAWSTDCALRPRSRFPLPLSPGLDATGKKAELVARLEGDAATNPSPAGGAASGTPNLDPSDMKVSELKDALGKEGLSTTGKKDELVARLRQAHSGKRPADAAAGGGQPSSKKAKVAAGPAWFWAADIGAGGREWRAYAADVCASLEKAILDVDLTEQQACARQPHALAGTIASRPDNHSRGAGLRPLVAPLPPQVTADHVVVLAPNATTGLYVQRSRANPSLTRPVARTQDGRPPASPPPQPKGPPSAARSSAPAAPAASSSLASSSAAGASVAKKSVKAGGVQQVRKSRLHASPHSPHTCGRRHTVLPARARGRVPHRPPCLTAPSLTCLLVVRGALPDAGALQCQIGGQQWHFVGNAEGDCQGACRGGPVLPQGSASPQMRPTA